jgi:hypothetical protein
MKFLDRLRYSRLDSRLYNMRRDYVERGLQMMYDWWLKNTKEGRTHKDNENMTGKTIIKQWEEKQK